MIWEFVRGYGIFGNTFAQYIYFSATLLISIILAKIAFKVIRGTLKKATEVTKTKIDDVILDSVEKPVVLGIILFGLYASLNILTMPEPVISIINRVLKVLILIDVTWIFSRGSMDIIETFIKPLVEKSQPENGTHFIYLTKRFVKIIIWVLGMLFIISNLGYDISTLIAGLGIGGVAIALAVKDILSNIFGGVTVITDMPFKVGDRIRVSGIDGKVNEIGMRSTKITSLDGTQYIVPNAKMIDSVIENVSREKSRKIKMTVGLEYGTSNRKIEQAKKIIENIILKNKATEDKCSVYFTDFGDSSLDILVVYRIKDMGKILQTKDEINLKIKSEFEKAKIEMAYPTQTLHIKRGK